MIRHLTRNIAMAAALAAAPLAALAHHGWSWTDDQNVSLTGIVQSARLGNPHGELQVDAAGQIWTVQVGQPWRNQRAGLEDSDMAPGTEIEAIGQRAADMSQPVMKAERLVIDGQTYVLYPNRS